MQPQLSLEYDLFSLFYEIKARTNFGIRLEDLRGGSSALSPLSPCLYRDWYSSPYSLCILEVILPAVAGIVISKTPQTRFYISVNGREWSDKIAVQEIYGLDRHDCLTSNPKPDLEKRSKLIEEIIREFSTQNI